jgi:2,3-diketo-5-methylthio-1-phosphopentane phosphatase
MTDKADATMARARVLLDFDGTVTVRDTVDALLERFAAPAWTKIEEAWKDGRIGSRECLARQTALINATPKEIDALVDSIAIDPGFDELLGTCEHHGIGVTIVSDGYRRSIERVLARGGHNVPARSGVLEYRGRRRWKLTSPSARAGCASDANTCKCKVAEESRSPTILIGDGRSDFCVAGKVDLVLAKDALARHCIEHGIRFEPIAGLAEAAQRIAAYIVKPDTRRAA